jgi:hypothetical protein
MLITLTAAQNTATHTALPTLTTSNLTYRDISFCEWGVWCHRAGPPNPPPDPTVPQR